MQMIHDEFDKRDTLFSNPKKKDKWLAQSSKHYIRDLPKVSRVTIIGNFDFPKDKKVTCQKLVEVLQKSQEL